MRFYRLQEAEPQEGYFGDESEDIGYFAEAPQVGSVCDDPGTAGYIAQDDPYGMGYVAQDDPYGMGYMAPDPDQYAGYVGDEYESPATAGSFADPPPGFTEGCASVSQADELEGYGAGEEDAMGQFYAYPDDIGAEYPDMGDSVEDDLYAVEDDPEMGAFAQQAEAMEGYVKEDREPPFSPRVMPVTSVSGVEGYTRPRTVNPTCESLRPAEAVSQPSSEWFKPLW